MKESKQQGQPSKPEPRNHSKPAEQKTNSKPSSIQPSTFDKGHPGQCPKEKTEDVYE
ncbi:MULTISPECIES: hypothetical protein [Comamonas]|jgi:hypothetical protein|uniref:hypothetical protein n=1 Tax=Comamonas TaxID=283 RepID=UPI00257F9EFD|nr:MULTISPECIES: hypothetical protein [Comamonas]